MQKIIKWLRQTTCCHVFRLEEQSLTGIPKPLEPPDKTGYKRWLEYYQSLDKSDWHLKRVQWPCAKCGKIFFAHCGLDILSKHGSVLKN